MQCVVPLRLLCVENNSQRTEMGRRPIRSEPQTLVVSDAAQAILDKLGWITYFMRMQQPNELVATEFLLNLQEGSSTVRGR